LVYDDHFAMIKKLRVLVVSPELTPLASTPGGPGKATRADAERAAAEGASVAIVLPRYRIPAVENLPQTLILPEFHVPVGADKAKAAAYKARLGDFDVYLIDCAEYFLRDRLYGAEGADYLDNDARFAFFARAAVELILKAKLAVDVVHCHDWPAALVPLYLRTHYATRAPLKDVASVLSVSDFAGNGHFPAESLAFTGLTWDYFTPDQLAQNGRFDFLKAGVVFSDALTGAAWAIPDAGPRGGRENGWAETLARRADAVVPPGSPILDVYQRAMANKKGGSHVR
jgi:starch synthase